MKHGSGVGRLPKGGSYVTLAAPSISPFSGKDFTIVIETMVRTENFKRKGLTIIKAINNLYLLDLLILKPHWLRSGVQHVMSTPQLPNQ